MLEKLKELQKQKQSHKFYANKLGVTIEEVKKMLKELKEQKFIGYSQTLTDKPSPSFSVSFTNITEEEQDYKTGNKRVTIQSNKPLSPKEIEKLVGADNLSVFVDRTWLKSQRDGTWTYSILTLCKIKDFYTTEEFQNKLKEIFKDEDYKKVLPSLSKIKRNKALFVYIGDDHAGLILENSLFNKEYSGRTYAERLLDLVQEIKNLGSKFDEIFVIRMGDEMDGYNGKTTRYDHSLGSSSNKTQFDIYTVANKIFYNELFSSGLASNYTLLSLSNSNHTGLGFSYMANKALEFWLQAKFPFVQIFQQEKFIDVLHYGNHTIGLVHGKDEKYMKAPMPLNLDYKTDLWLMDYYKQYHLQNRFISTIKADIHKFNINQGKSGRYVNVPSISSGSNWIEHNFGDSKPGALLEIVTEDSENIQSIPIWFK